MISKGAFMRYRRIGIFMIALAIILMIGVNYYNNDKRRVPLVYSPQTLLAALWNSYKTDIVEAQTFRALDRTRENISTSEGQSYTMLRAVWMDDKETFDQAWQWTKDNLQRDDQLFAWLFGELPNGRYGVLAQQGGNNAASDADADIALALIFASKRWGNDLYLNEARGILDGIWEKEVVEIGGRPYLAANDLEKFAEGDILINPSYLAPYAYKIFAQVDPQRNWSGLADTSYEVIRESSRSTLDRPNPAGLPPDWVLIDRETAQVKAPSPNSSLTTNFSYDALRVPFRLALDWQWFKDTRAYDLLSSFDFLTEEWEKQGAVYSAYSHDGQVITRNENPAMYGGIIGYFTSVDMANADEVFNKKLKSLYNTDNFRWKEPLGYYEDNMAWFGIALYYEQLTNLYQ
jgi:endoglucanase